jgi:hypothetical protein
MNDNFIYKAKLEELLLKNWSSFIDTKRFVAFVLNLASNTEFPTIKEDVKVNGTQLKLSRFEPVKSGFTIWVEFSIPKDSGMIIGTTELHMSILGDFTHVNTVGVKKI